MVACVEHVAKESVANLDEQFESHCEKADNLHEQIGNFSDKQNQDKEEENKKFNQLKEGLTVINDKVKKDCTILEKLQKKYADLENDYHILLDTNSVGFSAADHAEYSANFQMMINQLLKYKNLIDNQVKRMNNPNG